MQGMDLRAIYSGASGRSDGVGPAAKEATPGIDAAMGLKRSGENGPNAFQLAAGGLAAARIGAGVMSRVGSRLGLLAFFKKAGPLSFAASAVDVAVNDRKIREGGFAETVRDLGHHKVEELASQGVVGAIASKAVQPVADLSVVAAAAVEGTVESVCDAARTLVDGDQSLWNKAGAVLDATSSPITGVMVGARAIIDGQVDRMFEGHAADANKRGRDALVELFEQKLEKMTPDQREKAVQSYPDLSREAAPVADSEISVSGGSPRVPTKVDRLMGRPSATASSSKAKDRRVEMQRDSR